MLDHPARPKLQALLSLGEELLWVGQPRQGIVFRINDWVGIPLNLIRSLIVGFIGFSFTSRYGITGVGIGLICFIIAFYMTIGRFLADAFMRSRTYYGVTTRRIIIRRTVPLVRTTSYDLRALPHLRVDVKKNEEGSIYFTEPPNAVLQTLFLSHFSTNPRDVFDLIPDAQRVYELIQDVRDG